MRLVRPSFEIMRIMGYDALYPGENYDALEFIELCGRVCYKSEGKIYPGTAKKFVQKLIDLKHESVLEHSAMTVRFIVDRGVSHELVRHRLCAFSQESTRYCNYKDEVTFIIPPWIDIEEGYYDQSIFTPFNEDSNMRWFTIMLESEISYTALLDYGWSPQQARSILPNSLKTEAIVTANFREWKHIFKLRCSRVAHPQMQEIMIPLHEECKKIIPVIFDDIG